MAVKQSSNGDTPHRNGSTPSVPLLHQAHADLEVMPMPVVLCDKGLNVQFANQAALTALEGMSRDDVQDCFGAVPSRLEEEGSVRGLLNQERGLAKKVKEVSKPMVRVLQVGDESLTVHFGSLYTGAGAQIILTWDPTVVTPEGVEGGAGNLARAEVEAINTWQAVIHFEPDGTILDANANFLGAMGYERSEVVGNHHRMFVEEETRNSSEYLTFWERLRAGEAQSGEFLRLGKGGKEVWINASYTPIKDAKGNVSTVVKYATDVTEQKLRNADLEGQVVGINKAQAVIHFEPDGTILEANANFLGAMGYVATEMVGKHHRMFVDHVTANSAEYAQFWQRLQAGEAQGGEFLRIGKGGKEVWINASYTPIKDAKGNVFKVVKYATDVTEQKLRNTDFEGQIDGINQAQAVIHFQPDGTILDANANFLGAMGYERAEVVGNHHRMFVDEASVSSSEYKRFWERLRAGEAQAGEFLRIGRAGNEVWINASYTPIKDVKGNVFKVVKYARDITEEKVEAMRLRKEQVGRSAMMDASPVGFMFANLDGVIEYMNKSAREILQALEEHLPCKASEIVGKSFDIFHKNPSKQRGILSNRNNLPKEVTIEVGGEKLGLRVHAVVDPDDNYIGAMVAWEVVTKKVNIEQTVRSNAKQLETAASEMSDNARSMLESASQTTGQATSAAGSSEEISGNLQAVSAGAEEMSISIQEIAKNAAHASEVANEAVTTAKNANETVSLLGDASNQIGQIIKVITSIAQQTNLLALNATIEAARAGEAGKGFAVVANEVKDLAKETARATDDVSKKIEAIQAHTSTTVSSIETIVEIVERISEIQTTIAGAVEEQSATTNEISMNVSGAAEGTSSISTSVGDVARSAQETAEGAENTLTASTELSRLAAQLLELVA